MRNNRQKELLYVVVTIFSTPSAIQYRPKYENDRQYKVRIQTEQRDVYL